MAVRKIQPYKDAEGQFRWRRIGANGSDIIADSGQGYANQRDMLEMARANFPDDPFDWALLPDPDALIDDGDDEEDEANL